MRRAGARPPISLLATGLVAAAVAFVPGRAAATCGDYVVVRGQAEADRPAPPAHDARPAPGPCHGPGCSKAPVPADPPVLPAVSPPAGDQDCAACVGTGNPPPGPDQYAFAPAAVRPVRAPARIFHPPRTA